MEGQGTIYNAFYTILTYFFPADIVTAYKEVFVWVGVFATLAFVWGIIKIFKKLLGGW